MKLLTRVVDLDVIRTDGGTQVHEKLDEERIEEFRAFYEEGHEIEPILLVLDRSGVFWLADGFHRYEAQRRLGWSRIKATVRDGPNATLDMAKMLASKGKTKGRPLLLPGDRRRAVLMARSTPEGRAMGVRELAQHCGIPSGYVSEILDAEGRSQERGSEAAKAGSSLKDHPEGSNAGIAEEADSSTETVAKLDRASTGGMRAMGVRVLLLSEIRIDGGTQARAAIDHKTVDEYAEAMSALASFPAIVVYNDGADTWLADGFHRYHAAMKINASALDAEWRVGTREAAKLYAASANAKHGLRRTAGDKRRAIEMVLSTEEGRHWKQDKIAKHCNVAKSWVSEVMGKVRSELPQKTPRTVEPTKAEQKRARIAAAVAADPMASNSAIARQLGVDRETVSSVRAQSTAEPRLSSRRTRRSKFDGLRAPMNPMNLSSAEADKMARALLDSVHAACTVLTTPDWKTVLAEIAAIVPH